VLGNLQVDVGAIEGGSAGSPPPPPAPPPIPDLGAALDTFNRPNANTLGGNWQQLVVLANAGIRVNGNQAFCANAGAAGLLCTAALGADAYWNGAGAVFGATQAAKFTFANATVNNAALYLKASGAFSGATYANAIRVRYLTGGGGQVIVETTTNGFAYVSRGALAGSFANGDTLTALADASGIVYVWKTSGATTTFLGQVQLPTTGDNSFTTGSGRIGIHMPRGGRIDNFDGGTITS
jgi:hypothetical protein